MQVWVDSITNKEQQFITVSIYGQWNANLLSNTQGICPCISVVVMLRKN